MVVQEASEGTMATAAAVLVAFWGSVAAQRAEVWRAWEEGMMAVEMAVEARAMAEAATAAAVMAAGSLEVAEATMVETMVEARAVEMRVVA